MGACFGVGESNVRDAVDGEGVVEGAVIAEDAAVAVGGVFTETDVGDNVDVWEVEADKTDGLDDRSARVVCRRPKGIFCVGG